MARQDVQRRYNQSAKGRAAKRRYNKTARGREAKRWYKQTAKGQASERRYEQSVRGRAANLRKQARYAKAHPERCAAHHAVFKALRSGRLVRPARCDACLKRCAPHAHHYLGYAARHRLVVRWLCSKCHQKEHTT